MSAGLLGRKKATGIQEENSEAEPIEGINAVSNANVKCYWCQKKGHYASQCKKKQEYLAAKAKGKGGKGDKTI